MITLNFDTVYHVEGGSNPHGGYVPMAEHDDDYDVTLDGQADTEWHFITGKTLQQSYRGAVMHPSEVVDDDTVREWVREVDGEVFAIVVVETPQCDTFVNHGSCDCTNNCPAEPAGWAVIYKPAISGRPEEGEAR